MNIVPVVNGAKIAELRTQRHWDQQQLATQAGIAQSVISRIERDLQADYKISVVAAIAVALETSVDSLLKQPYQPEVGEVALELQELVTDLSHYPKEIQRQAVGIIRGYLTTLKPDKSAPASEE